MKLLRAFLIALIPTGAFGQAAPRGFAPADFWTLRRSADSIADAGDAAHAAPLYRRLVQADSGDVQLWLRLGNTELALHRLSPAESAFVHVFTGGFFRAFVARQIARIAAERGDKPAALAWLDSALAHGMASRASFQRDSAFLAYRDDERFRAIAGMLPRRTFSRAEGWRYDIRFFVAEARRIHTGFERPAYSPAFAGAAAELERRIPVLTDAGILAGLQHLAMLLDDGHSGVYRRTLAAGHTRLPVDLYAFEDGIYVVGARADHRDLVGSRVTRIGRLAPGAATLALEPYVPRDNAMRLLAVGVPALLTYPFQLQVIGAVDDTSGVPFALEDPDGRARVVHLVGDDPRAPQVLLMPRDTGMSNPLWLRNVSTTIWMTSLPDEHALYVQYNAVADASGEPIAQFAGRLHRALGDSSVRELIVDVRRNRGGNSLLNAPLHLAMFAFAQASPRHRIWILAGRHTFSAAQNFVNYLERFTNAVFVGEPTGSRPNFTGENGEVVLPYSGVIAEISNANHWSAYWEDQRPWIAPAVPVALRAADYFSNRDAALDAVKAMIRRGGD